jgi:hypothetical protein
MEDVTGISENHRTSKTAKTAENPPETNSPDLPRLTGKHKRENTSHQQDGPMMKFLKPIPIDNKRQLSLPAIEEHPLNKKRSISDYFVPGSQRGEGPATEQVRARVKKRTSRRKGVS